MAHVVSKSLEKFTMYSDFGERLGTIVANIVPQGGSTYVPPLPNELDVKDKIKQIIEDDDDAINIAIKL